MRTIVFELCAESVQACVAAREGGADRIELCSVLEVGGLTPSSSLVREAMDAARLPIHAMVRPRAGNFVYSAEEFAVMERDLQHLRELGVSGVVFGLLLPDGTVDLERTARLVRAAGPLEVTFHRAFDEAEDLVGALEDVIEAGCGRVLTSGGAADVVAGTEELARLVRLAAGRIDIAAGGGLRVGNAAALARATGVRHFHGSMRRFVDGAGHVESEDVRAVILALREG